MWLKPGLFFLLAPLLFVTAVQAAPPIDPPTAGRGSAVSASASKPHSTNVDPLLREHANAKGKLRRGSRYGIGYEARHGIDAGTRGDRMERPERLERLERPERPERIERDHLGR